MTIRIVHYINQFFAGIGGEEKADHRPEVREFSWPVSLFSRPLVKKQR